MGACQMGHSKIVKMLLARPGIDVNEAHHFVRKEHFICFMYVHSCLRLCLLEWKDVSYVGLCARST